MGLAPGERLILCAIILSLFRLKLTPGQELDYNDQEYPIDNEEYYEGTSKVDVRTYGLQKVLDNKNGVTKVKSPLDSWKQHERYMNAPRAESPERITHNETGGAGDQTNYNEEGLLHGFANNCGLNWLSKKQGLGEYIAGGYTVGYGDFPSYVRLEIEKDNGYLSSCGGTLITRQHVLTAAHCTRNVKQIIVRPTIYRDAPDTEQRYEASLICVNEYAHGLDSKTMKAFYDVSILKLDRPVTLSSRVQLACLPSEPMPAHAEAIAMGLGITDNRDSSYISLPDQLQALPVRRRSCRKRDQHETNVCFEAYMAGYIGDTCMASHGYAPLGDSGGPLMMTKGNRQVVAAITSYGPIQCHPGTKGYSVNADVYSVRKIIHDGVKACK